MIRTEVLILGGGLAGLSTAYHLDRLGPRGRYLLVEKREKVGGRAATEERDGFHFDHTGHLLHLHDAYGKKLITGLLKGNLDSHERSTWIYSHGVETRYPFQANTFGLPQKVIAECLGGFFRARRLGRALSRNPSFGEWVEKTFGAGIEKHFMGPYNRKLWRTPLRAMTTEWQGRFLPTPKPEEVLYGALTDQKKFFGYNAFFRYPKHGGIQALPDALAARLDARGVALGRRVVSVDLRERVAVIEGIGEVRYERLVNTMPLPEFLDLASELPAEARAARRRLRWVSVHNLNIGVARPRVSRAHWIYFPEKRFPFYRVGFPTNFSGNVAPRGTSSMYIEISRDPGTRIDRAALERASLDGLRAAGVLHRFDRVVSRLWIPIACAYVIYDRARTPAVATIMRHLKTRGASSIGRWGGWKYSFMEETILDGRDCARRLCGLPVETKTSRVPLQSLK